MNKHTAIGWHVNIDEAGTRLSDLVAAALRGEDVTLDEAGAPQVRLVPVESASVAAAERLVAKRRAALGMYKHLLDSPIPDIGPSMTDEELEERWNRKFGPAA